MSEAKQKYIAHIRDKYVPLFFRDYYLDAVSDKLWDVCLYEENGQIQAAYIYMLKSKWGLQYIVQPQLCPYTGPIYFSPGDYAEAYRALIDQLPRRHLIIQDYFFTIPKVQNLPYEEVEKHTYIIEQGQVLQDLWESQSSTHRRIIRKADREQHHEEVDDIEEFLSFVSSTFQKRDKKTPNDPTIFRRLDSVLKSKNERKIVKCTDNSGKVVAMCYFMNDEQWTYNFANSVVEDYRHYAMNLILWKEIEQTLSKGRSFDFEGSMISGVDSFFRRFKGRRMTYQSINHCSSAFVKLLVKIKTSL